VLLHPNNTVIITNIIKAVHCLKCGFELILLQKYISNLVMLVNSLLKESIQTKFKINVFMINHPLFLSQNINVFTIFARNLRKIKNVISFKFISSVWQAYII
jgi:hypothetical protein